MDGGETTCNDLACGTQFLVPMGLGDLLLVALVANAHDAYPRPTPSSLASRLLDVYPIFLVWRVTRRAMILLL